MKRSERLERINAINHGLENMASAKLSSINQEYMNQLNQLEQLRIYKDEYAEQLKSKMTAAVSTQELRDYKYFFSSIENAILQQESMVRHLQMKMEQVQAEWMEKRNEVEKINVAGENLKRAEAEAQARQEQKLNDELGMMMDRFHSHISH